MKSELNFKVIKNGQTSDMHELGIWVESFHIYSPNAEKTKQRAPGMAGSHLMASSANNRQVYIAMQIETDNMLEFDDLKHVIFDLFYSDGEFSIIRDLRPDREIFVIQEGDYDIENITQVDGEFNLTLTMIDPYVYGKEIIVPLNTSTGNIVNVEGTAPTKPIFELDVKAPLTFAMASNGPEYMLIGKPADVTQTEVDQKTRILREEGKTLSTWSKAGTVVDSNFSDISGEFGHDGSGIIVSDYGTGDKMHGPAVIKQVDSLAQDFEIEVNFDIITDDVEENYRMEVYFFDEYKNMLGKMGINDNTRHAKRYRALARVGEYVDSTTRYVIGAGNYQKELGSVSLFYFRVRRVGNKFTFYVSEVQNGWHVNSLENSYIDLAGQYAGRLKYVEIFAGKWQDRQRPFRARYNNINVYKMTETTVDQTPYIADVGDKILIDNRNRELRINGELVKKGELGASPFSLKPGDNNIVLLPSGALEGIMKYRPVHK